MKNQSNTGTETAENVSTRNVNVKAVTISPAMAESMLARTKSKNRPLSDRHVDELSREMSEGRWKFNGDTIRQDEEGNVIDGQHRLAACVRSGVPLTAFLVKGLEKDVFDTIDAGKARNASDALALRGEQNPSRLASTLRFVQNILEGEPARKIKYTNTEIEAILARNPGVRNSVASIKDTEAKLLVPFPILAGAHYLFSKVDRPLADRMVEQIITGSNLGENDPVHVFRERMLQLSLGSHRTSPVYIAALLVKTWNQVRSGSFSKTLSFRLGGTTPEKFPAVL